MTTGLKGCCGQLHGGAWSEEVGHCVCDPEGTCPFLAVPLTLLPAHHDMSSFLLPYSSDVSFWKLDN